MSTGTVRATLGERRAVQQPGSWRKRSVFPRRANRSFRRRRGVVEPRLVMQLYDYLPSGNGYKVRLLLMQLGHRFTLIEKDITKGETRTAEFLVLNPNGRTWLARVASQPGHVPITQREFD